MLTRFFSCAVMVMIAIAMSGCATRTAKPYVIRAQIAASLDVNPNREGRPSPVRVRIFQLREAGAFVAADYWALADAEQATLGGNLVQRLEQDLTPGEKREFELKIAPEANALGVVAEFANYRNAQWRVVAQRPNKSLFDIFRKDRVAIDILKDRAVIAVGD